MASLALLASKRNAGAAGGDRYAHEKSAAGALAAHLQSLAVLYEPYMDICGDRALPQVVVENQCDGVRTQWAQDQMMRLSKAAFEAVDAHDRATAAADPASPAAALLAASGGGGNNLRLVHRAKKYGIPHDGSAGPRNDRKVVAEHMARGLFRRYAARALEALFAEADARGLNRHDMADALLLAIAEAVQLYAAYCKTVLPRRRPGEQRPDAPPLPADQRLGTIRVAGLDPGMRNIGLAVVELVNMHEPLAPGLDPEPELRVLLLELVDLQQRAPQSCAVLHYRADSTSPVLVPRPDTLAPPALLAEVLVRLHDKQAARAERLARPKKPKRPRATDPSQQPPKKTATKRAKNQEADAKSLFIDLV